MYTPYKTAGKLLPKGQGPLQLFIGKGMKVMIEKNGL